MNAVNNKGFSLLELIVAIALIAIAGTALFNGFVMSGRIHMNTTQLQMAEDVAQQVAEDFNSQYTEVLIDKYKILATSDPSVTVTDTDEDSTGVSRKITFTNLPYIYSPRASADAAEFAVDVTLESVKTAGNLEVSRDTTYKQNSTEATSFFQIDSTVGTNTFIIPEVNNIYDGESVVVSSQINQHDNVVVSDLYTIILKKVDEYNSSATTTLATQVDEMRISSDFNDIYNPLINISSAEQLKKKTEIEIKAVNQLGGEIKYYYIVTVEYKFIFDFPVYSKTTGNAINTLSGLLGVGDLAHVADASVAYTVNKIGNQYTVRYEKASLADVSSDLASENGTFAGEIIAPNDPTQVFLQENTGTGTPVPYIYFLYVPFDLYSDTSNGECNDEIEFKYDGPTGDNRNIIRTFLVEQKVPQIGDPTVISKLVKCDINNTGYDGNVFKVYTNSPTIIDDTSNKINTKNYMTNSFGKKVYNLYDMEIVVKDKLGNVVATYNTVKEE